MYHYVCVNSRHVVTKKLIFDLGGLGFIGRHLVSYLIENNLADFIRVADKALLATAYLNEHDKNVFNDPRVDLMQANLTNPSKKMNDFIVAFVEKVFQPKDGKSFDYVINLAAETKYSQTAEVLSFIIFIWKDLRRTGL